jgi:nucleolin
MPKDKVHSKKQVESDSEEEIEHSKNNAGKKQKLNDENGKKVSSKKRPQSDDSDGSDSPRGKPSQKADSKSKSKARAQDSDDEEEKAPKQDDDKTFEVYVGGLPYSASEEDIQAHFEECGAVSGLNLLKGPDGRSKGIAFVRFDDEKSQNNAVKLNGSDFGGRYLKVEKSTGKPKKSGTPSDTNFECYVGGLPYSAGDDEIRDFFGDCGSISSVNLLKGPDGRSKGIAFVRFDNGESQGNAVNLNGSDFDGRSIKVEKSMGKSDKPRDGGYGGGRDRDGGYGGGRDRDGGYGGRGGGRGRGGRGGGGGRGRGRPNY